MLLQRSEPQQQEPPGLEQVPGMRELLPNSTIDMQSWYAVTAPAGVPADRVLHLTGEGLSA